MKDLFFSSCQSSVYSAYTNLGYHSFFFLGGTTGGALQQNRKHSITTCFANWEQVNPPDLGLLGLTVEEDFGGTTDATAVIVHEELSYADPAFCLAYLAHSLLFVNNLAVNWNDDQKKRFLPAASSGVHERTGVWYRCVGNEN